MGATDCSFTVKGKDRATVTKNFWNHVEDARHEHGHGGYSGTAAEFSHIMFTTYVFNNYDELQTYIVENITDKNVAYMVQMKVFKDTPTITKWLEMDRAVSRAIWGTTDEKQKAKLRKEVANLRKKVGAARLRKAQASKITEWVACGWVSE